MKSLHIAFFNRSFSPDTAATGRLLTELCKGLVQEHGCRVSVVAGVLVLPSAGDGGKLMSVFKEFASDQRDALTSGHGSLNALPDRPQ
jgi:hypothetical protein